MESLPNQFRVQSLCILVVGDADLEHLAVDAEDAAKRILKSSLNNSHLTIHKATSLREERLTQNRACQTISVVQEAASVSSDVCDVSTNHRPVSDSARKTLQQSVSTNTDSPALQLISPPQSLSVHEVCI